MASSFMPTQAQVSELPRLAIVAFAARCASRVEPLFLNSALASNYKAALSDAIEVTRLFAAALSSDDDARAADVAARAAYMESPPNPAADAAARVAFAAVRSAYDDARAADAAAVAAADAIGAARANAPEVIADFVLLRQKAAAQHWTHDTPVPATVFGKMWPVVTPTWALIRPDAARLEDLHPPLTDQSWFVEFLDAQGFTRTSPSTFGNGITSLNVVGTEFSADPGAGNGSWKFDLADIDPTTIKKIVLSLLKLRPIPGLSDRA